MGLIQSRSGFCLGELHLGWTLPGRGFKRFTDRVRDGLPNPKVSQAIAYQGGLFFFASGGDGLSGFLDLGGQRFVRLLLDG